jgi:1,2-diacylglycerol 3-alpha-glucosyltransferase
MVSEDYEPAIAGVGVHLQNLVRELMSAGHDVTIITSRKPHQAAVSQLPNLTVYRNRSIRLSGFYHSLTTSNRIRAILQRHRIDVVHIHFLSAMAVQAVRVARKIGIKTIYTYHMADEIFTSHLSAVPAAQALVSRQIIRFCNQFDVVTFPSQTLADRARARGLRATSRLLGNAVAVQSSVAVDRPHQDGFVVLYVGRLSPEKNLAFLIRVFQAFSARHPSAKLWLAGDGPIAAQLKALAVELGVESNVTFLGHVPQSQLSEHYRRADVFVLASFFETQGMVCIEAMQFGKPLLVSDGIVSCRELVDDGKNGFIFQHTNESDLLKRLELLITQPELRAQMAVNSATKASSFSLGSVMASHEDLYRSLVT